MGGNVAIHSTAIVAPDVEIGDGTIVGPFAVVLAPCTIGQSCWIGPHVVIGTTAEHLDAMTVAAVPPEASRDLDEVAQRSDRRAGVVRVARGRRDHRRPVDRA